MKNPKLKIYFVVLISISLIIFSSCGNNENQDPAQFSNTKAVKKNASGLTDFELQNGIGPVKQKLELGKIDPRLVKKGEEIFNTKCIACHKLDERYVGPAQRDVIKRRTPEYVMNMMLNPDEMLKKHPEAKKMLAEYMTPMTFQNLSFDDARAILEYFREIAK